MDRHQRQMPIQRARDTMCLHEGKRTVSRIAHWIWASPCRAGAPQRCALRVDGHGDMPDSAWESACLNAPPAWQTGT